VLPTINVIIKNIRCDTQSYFVHRNQIENDDLPAIPKTTIDLLAEMEKQYEKNNKQYFESLLNHQNYIIRTRAVCILAEIAGEESVKHLSKVLQQDDNSLVRHEAAFTLGQLGFSSGIDSLSHAITSDPSFFVRHEAAVALGVIGSDKAKSTLKGALVDSSEEVRQSALVALANLKYISTMKRRNKFTSLMGG
jgi:HEAT repeats